MALQLDESLVEREVLNVEMRRPEAERIAVVPSVEHAEWTAGDERKHRKASPACVGSTG